MARPPVSPMAEAVYAKLAPIAPSDVDAEAQGWHLLHFCEAFARMYRWPEEAFRSVNGLPAGSQILDVDLCPLWLLPWAMQFNGGKARSGSTEAELRTQMRDEPGFKRGTPAAFEAAAMATLTGLERVTLVERDTSAYHLTAYTYTSETPDPDLTEARIRSAKAAGLVLDFIVADGWLIGTMETFYVADTIATVEGDFGTIAALELNVP